MQTLWGNTLCLAFVVVTQCFADKKKQTQFPCILYLVATATALAISVQFELKMDKRSGTDDGGRDEKTDTDAGELLKQNTFRNNYKYLKYVLDVFPKYYDNLLELPLQAT